MKNEKLVAKRPLSHPEIFVELLKADPRIIKKGWKGIMKSLIQFNMKPPIRSKISEYLGEEYKFSGEHVSDFSDYFILSEWAKSGMYPTPADYENRSPFQENSKWVAYLRGKEEKNKETKDFLLQPPEVTQWSEFRELAEGMDDTIRMQYALSHWEKSGKPIYYFTPDLTRSLAFTEIPEKNFVWEPKDALPFRSLYVMLPPVFHKTFPYKAGVETEFIFEGFYLYFQKDHKSLYTPQGLLKIPISDSIGIKTIMTETRENRREMPHSGQGFHDPLSSHNLRFFDLKFEQHDPLNKHYLIDGKDFNSDRSIHRIATNLIWFLHNFPQAISHEQRTFSHADGSNRHHRRKRQNSIRKNKGYLNYSVLNLVSKHTKKTDKPASTSKKKATIVAGHLHTYWTGARKENGIEIPREEWEEKRIKIVKWILPYRKGIGEIVDRNIVVKW